MGTGNSEGVGGKGAEEVKGKTGGGGGGFRSSPTANRTNGQLAYLWRPYFRYMN